MKKKISVLLIVVSLFTMLPSNLHVQGATKSYSLYTGTTKQLKPNFSKKDTPKYKSSNTKVATVSTKGLISAKRSGTATITATAGKKKYTYSVKVTNPYLSVTKATLVPKQTLQLKIYGTKGNFYVEDKYKSIASTTKSGKVTAKKAGTAYVRIKGKNGKTYSCKITVKNATLNVTNANLYVGDSFTLQLNGATVKSFSMSNSSKYASVSKSGVVKAKKAGTCKVTVKDKYGNAYYCTLTISVRPVVSTPKPTVVPAPAPTVVPTVRPTVIPTVNPDNIITPIPTQPTPTPTPTVPPTPTPDPWEGVPKDATYVDEDGWEVTIKTYDNGKGEPTRTDTIKTKIVSQPTCATKGERVTITTMEYRGFMASNGIRTTESHTIIPKLGHLCDVNVPTVKMTKFGKAFSEEDYGEAYFYCSRCGKNAPYGEVSNVGHANMIQDNLTDFVVVPIIICDEYDRSGIAIESSVKMAYAVGTYDYCEDKGVDLINAYRISKNLTANYCRSQYSEVNWFAKTRAAELAYSFDHRRPGRLTNNISENICSGALTPERAMANFEKSATGHYLQFLHATATEVEMVGFHAIGYFTQFTQQNGYCIPQDFTTRVCDYYVQIFNEWPDENPLVYFPLTDGNDPLVTGELSLK